MTEAIIQVIICALFGYLVGCFNLSYFLSKKRGYDIRDHGSGNAGASNALIVIGKKVGVIVAVVDILKAYFVVRAAQSFFPGLKYAGVIAATAVILGHIFPFYMGFKGGKGFATLGGSILALDFKLFVILLIFAIFIAFITDYICVVPVTCSVIFSTVYGISQKDMGMAVILYVSSLFIILRHVENLKRILAGKELRLSFLWNRSAEAERLGIENDDGENYPFEYDGEKRAGKDS